LVPLKELQAFVALAAQEALLLSIWIPKKEAKLLELQRTSSWGRKRRICNFNYKTLFTNSRSFASFSRSFAS